MNSAKDCTIYVGTYTGGASEGIYAVNLDMQTGRLEIAGLAAKLQNPSYLVFSMDGEYIYAVLENESYEGETGGAAVALRTTGREGSLELLNIRSTIGRGPCHLAVDSSNRHLYTANYSEGSVTMFSLEADGRIGDVSGYIKHKGSGPNKKRQEGPHAHCTVLTPDEEILCVVDLGIDRILMYDLTGSCREISYKENGEQLIKPGSGPRHLVFHQNGRFAYLVNELSSDIAVLEYDAAGKEFTLKQSISALPEDYNSISYCGAIKISPDGRFVYASNRGHDSIAIFRIDTETGMLVPCGYQPTLGSYPRDFEFDPSGKYVIVANQQSGNLVSFYVNGETGMLEPTGNIISLDDAVCVKFTPKKHYQRWLQLEYQQSKANY